MSEFDSFTMALKSARLAEAARMDAFMNLRDARALRLETLREAVLARLSDHPQAQAMFELVVQPGAIPKLWIDLISSVVMEPDPRTWRLIQDRNQVSETLFETTEMDQMVDYLIRYLAHRMIAKDKVSVGAPVALPISQNRYSFGDIIYVWLTGCVFGAMALLSVAIYMEKLHF